MFVSGENLRWMKKKKLNLIVVSHLQLLQTLRQRRLHLSGQRRWKQTHLVWALPQILVATTPRVQKVLHESFKKKETSILVRVWRGMDEFAELQAYIVPNNSVSQKKQYMLRSIADPNYAVAFLDRFESNCLQLQGEWVWLVGFDFSINSIIVFILYSW